MRKNFTPEQMLHTVRASGERNAGGGSMPQARDHRRTFYKWKRRVAGMRIAELARLRQLEDENKKLKALVADLTLDKHMLQEVLIKGSEAGAQTGPGTISVR